MFAHPIHQSRPFHCCPNSNPFARSYNVVGALLPHTRVWLLPSLRVRTWAAASLLYENVQSLNVPRMMCFRQISGCTSIRFACILGLEILTSVVRDTMCAHHHHPFLLERRLVARYEQSRRGVSSIMSSAKMNQRDDAEFLARHAGVIAATTAAFSGSSYQGNPNSPVAALLARQNTWQVQVQDLLQQHQARYTKQSIQSVLTEEWASSYQETIRTVLQDEPIPLSATTRKLMQTANTNSSRAAAALLVPPPLLSYSGLKLVVPKHYVPSRMLQDDGCTNSKLTLRWTLVAPIVAPWFGPKDYKHHVYFMVRLFHFVPTEYSTLQCFYIYTCMPAPI
jgi:hypothetical protein